MNHFIAGAIIALLGLVSLRLAFEVVDLRERVIAHERLFESFDRVYGKQERRILSLEAEAQRLAHRPCGVKL